MSQPAGSEHDALATGNGTTAEVGNRSCGTHARSHAGASIAGQPLTHGLSAEALAHADRVAHAARTLLHHDSSDDEPPADPAQVGAAGKSVPITAADNEAALSHRSHDRAGADAAIANLLQPALTHADQRHNVAGLPHGMQRDFGAPVAGLPAASSLQNGGGVCNSHAVGEAEAIATHPDAMELTLKLSSSSEGPAATDRRAGSANALGSAVGLTAPTQPPLTLLLTPASSPTQSSAEPGGSAAPGSAADGTAIDEPLTLVLSPGSSREQGSRDQPVGATASGADGINAGALQLALSMNSGQPQQARSAGSDEHINAQMSGPSMPSGIAAEPQNSQPQNSNVGCSAPRSEAALSASAHHSAGQQSAMPEQAAQAAPTDDGARGPGSSAGTPGATIPTPSSGIDAVGPASAAPAQNRTPEESPLHLAQRTPGPAPLSRVPPTPHTGAALRAAVAPEATPSGGSSRGRDSAGGGLVPRPARRRVSSLLARASSDRASTPQVDGMHAAASQGARPTAAGGARRWAQGGDLPTLAEAVDGPGTVRLRNPPPTQVCCFLRKHCKPPILQGMLSEPLLIGAAAQQRQAADWAQLAQSLCYH